MLNRLKTITHRGRSILLCDYSHLIALNEWQDLLRAEHAAMAAQPRGSVRSLTIMTGARMTQQVTEAMKAVTLTNKPFVKVGAIVGLNPLQRSVLIKSVERDADRTWATFDTIEEAMDWLAKPD